MSARVEEEFFYACVHFLWVGILMGVKEGFQLLPIGVGLAFEVGVRPARGQLSDYRTATRLKPRITHVNV